MKKFLSILASLALVFTLATSASAGLENLTPIGAGTIVGGGTTEYKLIYDKEQDITWLDYTKGAASWDTQMAWADALEVNFGGTILSDWRLPSAGDNPQFGYNVTSSEMGHLYYESLGNVAYPTSGYGLSETGDFDNLINSFNWSGTEYSPNPNFAWDFYFSNGLQNYGYDYEDFGYHALAVMDGNAAAVPVPGAVWLLGSGLAGLAGLRRKITRK